MGFSFLVIPKPVRKGGAGDGDKYICVPPDAFWVRRQNGIGGRLVLVGCNVESVKGGTNEPVAGAPLGINFGAKVHNNFAPRKKVL